MGVPAPLERWSFPRSCKGLDLWYMVYLMPKSPKGSEQLYFNGGDRRCKIDCIFMIYLDYEDEGILSYTNSHTVSEVSQCIWESWGYAERLCENYLGRRSGRGTPLSPSLKEAKHAAFALVSGSMRYFMCLAGPIIADSFGYGLFHVHN